MNVTFTAEERKEWEKAGQTPLDKKFGAVFSRTRHGRCVAVTTAADGSRRGGVDHDDCDVVTHR
jgi:hypothetical protein